jgi:phosphate transport system substrate-binding protein
MKIHHDDGRLRSGLFAAALLACSLCSALLTLAMRPALAAGSVTLNETGSTLLYPLFQLWIPDYARVAPNVSITAAATGSGKGIDAAISGEARIGASDAYMSDEQVQKNRGILNIAVAISAQTVNYNVPGLNEAGVKLDGPTLAGIYSGKITTWDAPAIAAMNPGLQLPHQTIVPIRRAEASGDTFVFTQFLDFSTQTWEYRVGYGTSVAWPEVAGEKTATGNEGMVQALAATPYAVGYVGVSFRDAIAKAGLGTAPLKNQSGKFVLPTAETVSKGASALDARTPPDQRLTLVFAPGERSYPLVNYEYVVVAARQDDPEVAAALRSFLRWAVSPEGGNAAKYLDAVGFIPLPTFIRALSENQIDLIKAPSQSQ